MKRLFIAVGILTLSLTAMAAFSSDRVVVIPINGKSTAGSPEKLWGQGRTGTTTLLHDNGTFQRGSCTATTGVKFALSKHLASWEGAVAVCPKDTWVCSKDDILDKPCPITILNTYQTLTCDGIPSSQNSTSFIGWVSDSTTLIGEGLYRTSGDLIGYYATLRSCMMARVWCCHN